MPLKGRVKGFLKNQRGLTIIELLIAMAIFSLVMSVGYSFYSYIQNAIILGEKRSDVRQNIHLAANHIVDELKYATHVRVYTQAELADILSDGFDPDFTVFEVDDSDYYNFIYVDPNDPDGYLMYRKAGEDQPVQLFWAIAQEEIVNISLEFEFNSGDPPTILGFEITNVGEDEYSIKSAIGFLNEIKKWEPKQTGVAVAYKSDSLTIKRDSLKNANVDEHYSHTFEAVGGEPEYIFTSDDVLPPGLVLDEGGDLNGIPTEAETFIFTVTVTDDRGITDSYEYSLSVQRSGNSILSYSFPDISIETSILDNDNLIIVQVPEGTVMDNLIAEFTLSDEATAFVDGVEQVNGETENNFNDTLDEPFYYTVRAENGDEREWRIVVFVSPGNDGDGLVLVDGEPEGFQHEIIEPDSDIVVLSGNGYITMEDSGINYVGNTVTIESGVTFYSDGNDLNISIQAEEDLTIEPGVVFQTEANKSDIDLTSNSGDIIIDGVDFSVNHSSAHTAINISAPEGSVYMRGAKLLSIRDITIEARDNIMAGLLNGDRSEIIAEKNKGDIIMTLLGASPGIINVNGLYLSYEGEAIATPVGNICGILDDDSDPIKDYNNDIECNGN